MSGDMEDKTSMTVAMAVSVAVVIFVFLFVNMDLRFIGALFWALVFGGGTFAALKYRQQDGTAEGDRVVGSKPLTDKSGSTGSTPELPAREAAAAAPKADAPSGDVPPAANANVEAAPGAASPEPSGKPDGAFALRPTPTLSGQDEVSGFRGGWKYAADRDEPAPTEGPQRRDGPRAGGADDLKRIKGVGPKMEGMLNRMGFYHFDQIASWTEADVAWVDQNLEGFKGRVARDDWVAQARALAEDSA